ncbi:hypothetical protein MRB53_041311 [Persea americana]|nr:hypothetical protein MRB53_041311 [Persea americana]
MVFAHFVLTFGTNNVDTVGYTFTPSDIHHRSIGSGCVLAARIFYALFIWTNKVTVLETLRRVTRNTWRASSELILQGIRVFLFATFVAVIIATLAECRPFDHYWQVIPDPGPSCRLGYANLVTMGICDGVTDIILIVFPLPVVLKSGQAWKRKVQMLAFFSLSLVMVAITATRVVEVIKRDGDQEYRSIWASCEILASAACSNAIILTSFLRGKGTKKAKYKAPTNDPLDRVSTRRTIIGLRSGDSDENLFLAFSGQMPKHLRDSTAITPRLAAEIPLRDMFPRSKRGRNSLDTMEEPRQSVMHGQMSVSPPSPSTTRSVNLFDVGNLLEDNSLNRGRELPSAPRSSATADYDSLDTIAVHKEALHAQLYEKKGDPAQRQSTLDSDPRHASSDFSVGSHWTVAASIAHSHSLGKETGHGAQAEGNQSHSSLELADVGGLLASDHEMDLSAAALHEAIHRDDAPRVHDAQEGPS